jgi:hypothetical protein
MFARKKSFGLFCCSRQRKKVLLNCHQVQRKFLDDKIRIEIVKYLEDMLDKPVGRSTLDQVRQN